MGGNFGTNSLLGGVGSLEATKHSIRNQNKLAETQAATAMARDKAVATAAVKTISRLNVERTSVRRQLQGALFHASTSTREAEASAANNAAASGQTGASVQAVLSDVERVGSRAAYVLLTNNVIRQEQIDNQVSDTVNGAIDRFVGHTLNNAVSEEDARFMLRSAYQQGAASGMGASTFGGSSEPTARDRTEANNTSTSSGPLPRDSTRNSDGSYNSDPYEPVQTNYGGASSHTSGTSDNRYGNNATSGNRDTTDSTDVSFGV